MTIGEIIPLQDYDYLIHIHDSKFKVKSGVDSTTVYESTNLTDALGAFQYCRDQMGVNGGLTKIKSIPLNATPNHYPFSAPLTYTTASHFRHRWQGSGDWMAANTRLFASNNTPIFSFDSASGSYSVGVDGLYCSHAQAAYSSSLIHIKNFAVDLSFSNIYGSDNGMYKGNLFGLECLNTVSPLPSQYKLAFQNIALWGLENAFYVNNQVPVVGGNNSMTSFLFSNIFAWNCKHVAKVDGVSGAQFLAPHFDNIFYQYSTANPLTSGDAVYNFDAALSTWLGKMVNCTTWDFPTGVSMINVGSSTEIMALNCNRSDVVGGPGASTGKFKQFDYYTFAAGETTMAATLNRSYVITHNLGKIPKHIQLTVKNTDYNTILAYSIPANLITTTQFTVRFQKPPALPNTSGGQNLNFGWRVYY